MSKDKSALKVFVASYPCGCHAAFATDNGEPCPEVADWIRSGFTVATVYAEGFSFPANCNKHSDSQKLKDQVASLTAQLAEANQRVERAEQAEKQGKRELELVRHTLFMGGRELGLGMGDDKPWNGLLEVYAVEIKRLRAALSAGVLPEGAVPDDLIGYVRLKDDSGVAVLRPPKYGDLYRNTELGTIQKTFCDWSESIANVRGIYVPWHPPKAESGEGDEYAQDPDAGTLASELCRIADSIGRNDCTRSWAEKFIYSIVDELPPAIASHVMRPPITEPAPKAPAASEEPENPKQSAAMAGGPFDAQDNARAANFLKRLRVDRGAIVSSADCSTMEIAFAQKEKRFYVDSDSMGYVMRMKPWREECERLIEARCNARDVSDSPSAPPAADVGGGTFQYNGKTWRYTGEIRLPREGEHYFHDASNDVWLAHEDFSNNEYRIVVEVPPVTAKGTQYAADITDEMQAIVGENKAKQS